MALVEERAAAIEAVRMACAVCEAVQQKLVADTTLTKGDRSPVTVADFSAQAIVSQHLGERFPDIPMVGEEDASDLRGDAQTAIRNNVVSAVQTQLPTLSPEQVLSAIDRGTYTGGPSGRHWVLDPIDGTKGFLRLEQYAVALALIEDGEVVLGVLGCPNLPRNASEPDGPKGCLFVAVKGQGAVQISTDSDVETPISVDGIANLADARFCESVEKAHSSHSHSAQIADVLGITRPPFRMDSQCKYAAVARGDASAYLRLPTRPGYQEKIWDHAAGWRVIVEAGGAVTDIHGKSLDFSLGRTLADNKGVIVTNGALQKPILAATRQVLG